MWIMFIISVNVHCYGNGTCGIERSSSTSITSTEFSSREKCLAAASFSIKRQKVVDAWCVQK